MDKVGKRKVEKRKEKILRSFTSEEAKIVFGFPNAKFVEARMLFETRQVGIFNWTGTMMKKYSMLEYIKLVKRYGMKTVCSTPPTILDIPGVPCAL